MHHRTIRRSRHWYTLGPAFGLVALGALACAAPDTPTTTGREFTRTLDPSFHVGCEAGGKFTGGGRVDPEGIGKVTFGFNIHGGDCAGNGTKGSLQIVYHERQTIIHSIAEGTHFASFNDPEKGACGEWEGTARVKHVDADNQWHEHHYFIEVCDKAEPGVGADRISFYIDGERGLHNNIINEVLTGGNIQAHKN